MFSSMKKMSKKRAVKFDIYKKPGIDQSPGNVISSLVVSIRRMDHSATAFKAMGWVISKSPVIVRFSNDTDGLLACDRYSKTSWSIWAFISIFIQER